MHAPDANTPARRRVAVAVEGPRPPAWQATLLDRLDRSDTLELVAVEPVRPRRRRVDALWRLHRAFERRWFGVGRDALARDLPATPRPLDPARPPELRLWLLDGEPPANETTADIWLRHGEAREGAAEAFRRAVRSGEPWVETEVCLRLPGEREASVIARSVSAVRPFSATVSANSAVWKSVGLVIRAAAGPLRGEPAEQPGAAQPVRAAPFLLRALGRLAQGFTTRVLYRRPWAIAIRELGTDAWEPGGSLVGWQRGHVYADPFLIEHDGAHHLFCEHIPEGEQRGVISHARVGEGSAPVPVLTAPHHLSYPFVFARDGEVFMIPESSTARRVELYRAAEFPHRWELDTVLLEDVDAVDATLLEDGGRLWLFVGIAAYGGSHLDELHLFSAAALRGPWTPHPRNPVVSDVRGARPAGAVLRDGDRLVRPAQDGSRRYGWALSFREIDTLTEADYSEHEVRRIEPEAVAGARAVHTYNRDSRYEALDLRRREPRFRR